MLFVPQLSNINYIFIFVLVISIFTSYKISTGNVEKYNKLWFNLNNFLGWFVWITNKSATPSGSPDIAKKIKGNRSRDDIFKSKLLFLLVQLWWFIPIILVIMQTFQKEYHIYFIISIIILLIITWALPFLIVLFFPVLYIEENKLSLLNNFIKILKIILSLLVILLIFNNGNIYLIYISLILIVIISITLLILSIIK